MAVDWMDTLVGVVGPIPWVIDEIDSAAADELREAAAERRRQWWIAGGIVAGSLGLIAITTTVLVVRGSRA
jgi:hypothetical protein